MRNIVSILIAACSICALLPCYSYAWGKKGHAVVALIAAAELSSEARSRVQALLGKDGAQDMASVASWADQPTIRMLSDRPMHTVRMRMDNAPYSEGIDCQQYCAIKGIDHAKAVLSDPSAAVADQVVALKDLIHLIGDIHQPLHTVENIGGQPVTLKGEATTLHHVWDYSIIRSQGQSAKKLAGLLIETSGDVDTSGGPAQWATEGRDIAIKEIYSEIAPSRKSAPSTSLSDDYLERHWPTVKQRLQQAGLRLALMLNQIYAR